MWFFFSSFHNIHKFDLQKALRYENMAEVKSQAKLHALNPEGFFSDKLLDLSQIGY